MLRPSLASSFVFVACACAPSPVEPAAPPRGGPPVPDTAEPAPVATIVDVPPPPPEIPKVDSEPGVPVDVTSVAGWATFHGNSARTGATTAPAIRSPRILWKAQVGTFSWLNSPLALGKSLVIAPSSGSRHNTPDSKDGVSAFHLASGKRAWFARFDADANGVAANQTHVFATSDDEHVHALDIKTGKTVWKARGTGKMYTHPLIVGDRVVVGDAGGWVQAFGVADGKKLWKVQLSGAIRGGASSDGTHIFVASQGGDVAALTLEGKTAWRKAVKRPAFDNQGPEQAIEVYSTPVVGKTEIYLPFARDTTYTDQPGIVALSKKTGALVWRAKGRGEWGNLRSTPVLVAENLVYGEPYSGDVAAIDAKTGRVQYRSEIGGCFFPQWSSPAAAGDLVYLPRFDGTVYALGASTGKVAWEMFLGDSKRAGQGAQPKETSCTWENPNGAIYAPAAIAEDGTLFIGTAEGVLYALTG